MVYHVVLFRPRPDLTPAERSELAAAFERARRDIPSVRGFRVGRRITLGTGYDVLMTADYPYAAMVEFDDASGLQRYLQHPAHEALGARFGAMAEAALIYDFEMSDEMDDIRRLADEPD